MIVALYDQSCKEGFEKPPRVLHREQAALATKHPFWSSERTFFTATITNLSSQRLDMPKEQRISPSTSRASLIHPAFPLLQLR